MPAKTATPTRADAVRNRERLLAAAVERFAEQGADASLEAIAREAGVGIGTLYRHFPNRAALVEAAFRSEVDQVCAAAPELLTERPPAEALEAWLLRYVDYLAAKRGMAATLRAVMGPDSTLPPGTGARERNLEAISLLLEAGKADGSIRSDVDAEDVTRALSGLWHAPDDPQWHDRARRLARLVMDGLRTPR